MRVLIDDPARIDDRAYRRFVRRAEVEGMLVDHLVVGQPYLALNGIVLDAGEAALLDRLTEVFAGALQRAARELAGDVPALVELGFPWVAAELLAAEPRALPLVGRFDFVRDGEGRWWLLEFNADTPSGIREAIVADELVRRLLPEAGGLERPSEILAGRLVGAFERAAAGLPKGSAIGLVTTASELEDLAQMAFTRRLLCGPLAARGIEVVLGDADNLRATRRGLSLCGRRVAALYRYVPFEPMLGTAAFAAIFEAAMAGRLRLLNGLYGLLLQHKGLLAHLWARRDDPAFSPAERAAIRDHLPPTWPIEQCRDDVGRAELVAKQVFGREGEEVYFGEDLGAERWRELASRRTYVAQRRIRIAELDAAVPTALDFERRRGCPTVGAFAVGGRAAGYYTRFGGKIITSRAHWLATLVERATRAPGGAAADARR